MLCNTRGKDFRATTEKISSVLDPITEPWQDEAVLTGIGQLPSIFQIHVCLFSPGRSKCKKLKQWKQYLKLLLCLQGAPLEALVPHIWSLAWQCALWESNLEILQGKVSFLNSQASPLRGSEGLNIRIEQNEALGLCTIYNQDEWTINLILTNFLKLLMKALGCVFFLSPQWISSIQNQ